MFSVFVFLSVPRTVFVSSFAVGNVEQRFCRGVPVVQPVLNLFGASARLFNSSSKRVSTVIFAVFISVCIPSHKQAPSVKVTICDLHTAESKMQNDGDTISETPNSVY